MMAKSKLLPPDLPDEFLPVTALDEAFFAMLESDEDIEAMHFMGVCFESIPVRRVSFRNCLFEKCVFIDDEKGTRFDFLDCAFAGCDFAGMQFSYAAFQRVSMRSCRGVGMYASDTTLRSVTLNDCQLTYANFGLSKMNLVEFTDCDLSHAAFGEAQFKDVTFIKCRLSGAELFGTRLKGMDLRTNAIDGIVLSDRRELEGARVTPLQACDLALLLGVIIES